MKHIIINDLGIKKEDITKTIIRIKVLLINSNNEILLGYSKNCFQFIGGHKEENESLLECLNREILEEVGINLNISDIKPFLFLEHYCKDHPKTDENRNCQVYYYVVKTDLKPNLEKTHYTKEELENHFKLVYVNLDKFIDVITNNYEKYPDALMVGMEMIRAYNCYLKNNI